MSLIKFMDQKKDGKGNALHWGRADIDGAPYRGAPIPGLTESEAEDRLVRIAEPYNRVFDLSVHEDNVAYLEVCDKVVNGWAKFTDRKRVTIRVRKKLPDGTIERDVKFKIYVEWVEVAMTDGKPMASQRPYLGRPND